jgi:hypothetical protein
MEDDEITITAWDNMSTTSLGSEASTAAVIAWNSAPSWTDGLSIDLGNITGKRKSDPNETVLDFKVSPLAIMLQLLDNGTELYHVIDTMSSGAVESLDITESNIQLADEIKEYYRAKIITDTLSARTKRSEYRSDLIMALALLDMCQTKRSFMPILVKLPEFYREDTKLEKITSTYRSISTEKFNSLDTPINLNAVTLRLVEQVCVNRRSQRKHEFYFADPDNYLYVLNTELKNALIPFLNVLTNSKTITLRCKVNPTNKRFYNFNYYTILPNFEVTEIA